MGLVVQLFKGYNKSSQRGDPATKLGVHPFWRSGLPSPSPASPHRAGHPYRNRPHILHAAVGTRGSIFTTAGQTILTNLLVDRPTGVHSLDPHAIVNGWATNLASLVPDSDMGVLRDAYNFACTRIFLAAMGVAFAALLGALGVKWKSIKKGINGRMSLNLEQRLRVLIRAARKQANLRRRTDLEGK